MGGKYVMLDFGDKVLFKCILSITASWWYVCCCGRGCLHRCVLKYFNSLILTITCVYDHLCWPKRTPSHFACTTVVYSKLAIQLIWCYSYKNISYILIPFLWRSQKANNLSLCNLILFYKYATWCVYSLRLFSNHLKKHNKVGKVFCSCLRPSF